MEDRTRVYRGTGSFGRAQADKADGERVCGTYVDGKPAYFLMPAGADDIEIRDRAFAIKTGRPIGEAELLMLAMPQVQRRLASDTGLPQRVSS